MAHHELFDLQVLVDDDEETSGKVPNIKEALSRRQLSAGRTADYRLPEVPASLGTGYQLDILTAMRLRTLNKKKSSENPDSLVLWHKSPILRRIYAKSAPPPGEPLRHANAFKKAATEKAEEGRQSSMTVDHEIRRVFRGFDFRDVDVSNLPVVKDILKDGDSEMTDTTGNPGDKPAKKRSRKESRCDPQKRHHIRNGLDDRLASSGVQDCETPRSYKTEKVSRWISKHFRHRSHWDDI
ncbi:Hypp406 [Branchiostoma lanceolatum]|uniref:Hypp406 protein n=1 Tax=Branchiostoma lanceolatum TaxID=7740 RepID=A0A8J9VLS5_BRALA|nr:Hypp406 [Branchiostoma lanceolatum]